MQGAMQRMKGREARLEGSKNRAVAVASAFRRSVWCSVPMMSTSVGGGEENRRQDCQQDRRRCENMDGIRTVCKERCKMQNRLMVVGEM